MIADQLGYSRISMTQDVYLGRKTVDAAAASALEGLSAEVVVDDGDDDPPALRAEVWMPRPGFGSLTVPWRLTGRFDGRRGQRHPA